MRCCAEDQESGPAHSYIRILGGIIAVLKVGCVPHARGAPNAGLVAGALGRIVHVRCGMLDVQIVKMRTAKHLEHGKMEVSNL